MRSTRRTFWNSNFFLITMAVVGTVIALISLVVMVYLADLGTPSFLPWIIGGWGALLVATAYEEWSERGPKETAAVDEWETDREHIDA